MHTPTSGGLTKRQRLLRTTLITLMTVSVLTVVAFVIAARATVPFGPCLAVALASWLVTLTIQRAFRGHTDDSDLDAALRGGRTDAAELEATIGRGGAQPGTF